MYLLASIVSILVLWADWYLWKKYFKGRGLLGWLWWLPTVLLVLFVIGAISGIWHTFFMRASYLLVFVSVQYAVLKMIGTSKTGVLSSGGLGAFKYYTVLSNVFCALSCLYCVFFYIFKDGA
ncbi:MAG: hypothetical protein J6X63_05415, partial [Bacteroidales bacterium]|nr:hypothetical protein [Bacteroidales bacterium]